MPMPCFTLFFYYFIISSFRFDWLNACFSILQPVPFFFLCACVLASAARVRLRIERREVTTQTLAIPYENAVGSKDLHGETLTCLPPDHSLYRIYSFHSLGFGCCPGMARCGGVCNCKLRSCRAHLENAKFQVTLRQQI